MVAAQAPSQILDGAILATGGQALKVQVEFTVSDPPLYTQTWRAELPFRVSSARILEDACHEGNYSLAGILAGARQEARSAVARNDGR